MRKLFIFWCGVLLALSARAQKPSLEETGIRIFIDCNAWCDFSFIRTEISYIDFVPDPYTSNLFVQILAQPTGSGGAEVTLFFVGKREFEGMQDTLRFNRSSISTEDEYRNQLVQYLKLGITRYLAQTPMAAAIDIGLPAQEVPARPEATRQRDPWNAWIINLSLNGNFNLDDYNKNYRYSSGLEASKTTEELKWNSGLYYRRNVQEIRADDSTRKYYNLNYYAYAGLVRSLGDHWAFGGSTVYEHNTFSNYQSQVKVLPAMEYSVFPYREAVRRAITIYYEVGPSWNQYIDTAFYGSKRERVIQQSLSLNSGFIQKWGNVSASASWFTFLNGFRLGDKPVGSMKIHNFSLGGRLEIRLIKGLFLNAYAGADFTKGVFPNLRREDFTAEDILTNVRQYPTTNRIYSSFGINYRFGSIYNNVVNPRFQRNRFF